MPEHQTIEYKESWHDDFLEWICGYANAYAPLAGVPYKRIGSYGALQGV